MAVWTALVAALIIALSLGTALLLGIRYEKQIDSIQYPMKDPMLLRMAEDDLWHWTNHSDKSAKKRFLLSGPSSIPRAYNGKTEVVLVRFSTSRGISYVSGPDHLRLLWFTCSFRRIAEKLRRLGIEVDTYLMLNWGDYYTDNTTEIPVLSKSAVSWSTSERGGINGTESDRHIATRDITIPYEELLWNYPLQFNTPWETKTTSIVYRGSCTNKDRVEMVHHIREVFAPPRSDVAVSCESGFQPLGPEEQARYRYLLDYDGEGYSRRLAWYLQTGSVVLKGGVIDDMVSRLAAIVRDRVPGDAPMAFWKLNDGSMEEVIRNVVNDESYSKQLATAGLRFWEKYIHDGQAIWDGYLAHLIVQHDRRFDFVVKESAFLRNQKALNTEPSNSIISFSGLGRCSLVCALVLNGATPTKEGLPNWRFVAAAVVVELALFAIIFLCLLHWRQQGRVPMGYKVVPLFSSDGHDEVKDV